MYWKTVGCCAAQIWHTFWPIYIETSVSMSLDWPCFLCVLLTIHFPLQINGSNKHDQIPPTIASGDAMNLVCDNCIFIFHIDLSRVSSPDGLVRHHLYVYLLCCTLPYYMLSDFFWHDVCEIVLPLSCDLLHRQTSGPDLLRRLLWVGWLRRYPKFWRCKGPGVGLRDKWKIKVLRKQCAYLAYLHVHIFGFLFIFVVRYSIYLAFYHLLAFLTAIY